MRLSQKIVKYFVRIQGLPDRHIVKQMYHSLESLDKSGFHTWVTDLRKHLSKLELAFEDLTNLEAKHFKGTKNRTDVAYASQALQLISDTVVYPKLRTFKLFKTNFTLEPYLSLSIPKYRQSLSKFRLSSHALEIEMGRYTRPFTPAEERKCKICNQNQVEDEIHFLLVCKKYDGIRSELKSSLNAYMDNLNLLDLQSQFTKIMSCTAEDVIHAVGKYLYKAEQIRKVCIQ